MEGLTEDGPEYPMDLEDEGDMRLATIAKDPLDLDFQEKTTSIASPEGFPISRPRREIEASYMATSQSTMATLLL